MRKRYAKNGTAADANAAPRQNAKPNEQRARPKRAASHATPGAASSTPNVAAKKRKKLASAKSATGARASVEQRLALLESLMGMYARLYEIISSQLVDHEKNLAKLLSRNADSSRGSNRSSASSTKSGRRRRSS